MNYSADQMREALKAGATYLEHVFNDCTPQVADPLPPSVLGDAIKAIGPEHCIMSTDSGQVVNPPPGEGHDPLYPGDAGVRVFREGDPGHDRQEPREDFGFIGRR